MKQIPPTWTDSDLLNFFNFYGKITQAYIVQDNKSRSSLNFGYVVTETEELAIELQQMRKLTSEGVCLLVSKHSSPQTEKANQARVKPELKKSGIFTSIKSQLNSRQFDSPLNTNTELNINQKYTKFGDLLQFRTNKQQTYSNSIGFKLPTGETSNRVTTLIEESVLSNPFGYYLTQRVQANHDHSNTRVNLRSTVGHPYLELDMYLLNYRVEQQVKMSHGMKKRLSQE